MKKEWKSPKFQNLAMQYTEGINPIISCSNSDARIEPSYSWMCPCCGATSPHKFDNDTNANKDFKENHLPKCKSYNYETDSCIIS